MWFYSENYGGYYWISGEEGMIREAAPKKFPANAQAREPEDGDFIWDLFVATNNVGQRAEYKWVVNGGFIGAQGNITKQDFPKLVTSQTLADFFKSDPQKYDALRLDEETILTRSKDFTNFTLSVKTTKLVGWNRDKLSWYSKGTLNPYHVKALAKYLVRPWKFTVRDDMCGFQNEKGEWILASQYVNLSTAGVCVERETYEKTFVRPWLTAYGRLLNSIDQYVAAITPEKIQKDLAGLSNKTHSISTRCHGCQTCNGSHLEIHVIRKDLDAYLIYSALDAFGFDKNAIQQTWNLIANPASAKEFQPVMRNFLLDTLRNKIAGPTFIGLGRRQGSNQWTLHNAGPFRVDGGVRLVAGRDRGEEAPFQREGDGIAEEAMAAVRRAVRPPRRENLGVEWPVLVAEPNDVRRRMAWNIGEAVAVQRLEAEGENLRRDMAEVIGMERMARMVAPPEPEVAPRRWENFFDAEDNQDVR